MPSPSKFLLYVKDIRKSAEFYRHILDSEPVIHTPGFAQFILSDGVMLGLWHTAVVQPEAELTGGGAEYLFELPDAASLKKSYEAACAASLVVIQVPIEMGFGLTYVIEDPDRHRIRYYVPTA